MVQLRTEIRALMGLDSPEAAAATEAPPEPPEESPTEV